MLHNANTIYLLISNQHFCSFSFSLHLGVFPKSHVGVIWLIAAAWRTSSKLGAEKWKENKSGGKHKLHIFEFTFWAYCIYLQVCTPSLPAFIHLSVSLFPSLLVPLCYIPPTPSFSVSCYFLLVFNPLCPFLPPSLSCFLSKKRKETKRKRKRKKLPQVEGVFYPYLCFSSCPPLFHREYRHRRQYLDSSSRRQGSSIASLYKLASEAVMSKPETSQGQNTAIWLPPCPVMTDREIVLSLWEAATIFNVCSTATGPGRRAKMSVWLIRPLVVQRSRRMTSGLYGFSSLTLSFEWSSAALHRQCLKHRDLTDWNHLMLIMIYCSGIIFFLHPSQSCPWADNIVLSRIIGNTVTLLQEVRHSR